MKILKRRKQKIEAKRIKNENEFEPRKKVVKLMSIKDIPENIDHAEDIK